MSRRLLLDLNVILDVLLDRKPHATAASALWSRIEGGGATGYLAAHGITTIHYLAARARGRRFARQIVEDLLTVFRIVAVDEESLRRALSLSLPDFEDAVCCACAAAADCEAIVTRDPRGFRGSPTPAIDPATALEWLTQYPLAGE